MNQDLGSVSHARMASMMWRKYENGGSEESSSRNHRRNVGGVGYAIRILDYRRRGFPAAAIYKIAAQSVAACNQAVMAVRRRQWRQEGKRLSAPTADTAANPDPVMVLIMSLFASATVTDDGILLADRASAQDDFRARLGPVGSEVALRRRK